MAWMEQQTGNERSQKETEDTTRTCSSGFGLCAAVTCHGTPPNQDQHTPTGCEDHMFCSKGAQKICSILHISMITGEIPHLITHPTEWEECCLLSNKDSDLLAAQSHSLPQNPLCSHSRYDIISNSIVKILFSFSAALHV